MKPLHQGTGRSELHVQAVCGHAARDPTYGMSWNRPGWLSHHILCLTTSQRANGAIVGSRTYLETLSGEQALAGYLIREGPRRIS